MRKLMLSVAVLVGVVGLARGQEAKTAGDVLGRAENVIVVTIDGLRWQEVFGGAESERVVAMEKGKPNATMRAKYLTGTAAEKRERLMPFFWGTVAKEGQVFGDRESNCVATVTNKHRFSYPGYSELTVGFVDERVNSNDDFPNPNATVFEWLHRRPGFDGKVAAFGAWDRCYALLNPKRSGVHVMAGWRGVPEYRGEALTEREKLLNEMLATDTRVWGDEPSDVYCMSAALEFLKVRKPRVMYVMLGETDEWAHANRYELYLSAATKADGFLKRVWEAAASMPEYAGKTALVVTCDHGRGNGGEWTGHGEKVEGADGIWMAVMGPDTPALGVRKDVRVTQSQVAATVANLVGEDYRREVPKAAEALPGVVGRK